jgi:membrane fusion protein (multidrug efflux system)
MTASVTTADTSAMQGGLEGLEELEALAPAAPLAQPVPGRKASRRNLVVGGALALAVAGGAWWYAASRGHETTDDAQIDADVVSVPARAAGTIAHVYFTENQAVHEGDLLAMLDDAPARTQRDQAQATYQASLAAAEAADADQRVAETNATGSKAAADAHLVAAQAGASSVSNQIAEAEAALGNAEATLAQARDDRDRDRKLFEAGAVPRTVIDQRETALSVAENNVRASRAHLVTLRSGVAQATGQVAEAAAHARQSNDVDVLIAQAKARAASARAQAAQAKAALDLAELNLSYTRVLAPHDGVVSKKTILEGQTVAVGQPVVQLVTPGVWVTANFKETQLEKMHVGQEATFSVDAYPSLTFHGTIESFSGATGSRFTLLPPDNASGNFTKVVQRVPVRIRVTETSSSVALRPGLSVEATVNTRS